ncbi:NADH-quinone oxidoreductase subunit D-related protein [Caldovatus aquaticus]|uniref:Nickel-dependent hydrogenase large subunit n=1 Tax=Caldovatus aquaticus TaxID=2865671 RepID=A0ABS7F297_9PROT|nr:nickel-dependent hydrogenase large subunit [Caldovatus aquaticus]MBW8269122.1 nickel-dependent hydrogenase large subunit [Caldovatus aquaticus]
MTGADDRPASRLIRGGAPQGLRGGTPVLPAERYLLPAEAWARLPAALAAEPELELLALWAEPGQVHAAFLDRRGAAGAEGAVPGGALMLASAAARGAPPGAADGAARYPALSPVRPGAARFERLVRDLWGLEAEGGTDPRPWLDHGRWPVLAPLAAPRAVPRPPGPPPQPQFLPASGAGVRQIPLGPIRGRIAQAAELRLHVQGEAVLRAEHRLGYTHKGTLSLILGKSPRAAARFAARLAGDSTVAHASAFAAAAEAAAGIEPPPRARHLRALMLELERLHNHLRDAAALFAAAGLDRPRTRCLALREGVLRAAERAFGHRLMMDHVVPGGVAIDIAPSGPAALQAALAAVEAEQPGLMRLARDHGGLGARLGGLGRVDPALAARFAACGVVGRASGRGFDARHAARAAPYDALDLPPLALRAAGDAAARLAVRIEELAGAARLARALLADLPAAGRGETLLRPLPQGSDGRAGEGIGLVEGCRGACLHWLRLDDGGLITAAFLRDPSWLHWPLLEAAIARGDVADIALCERSFSCSASGVDL